jgi:mannose-1-phosphate guanylyltransferase
MEVDALLRTHAHGKGLATLAFRPGAPGTGTLGARADGRVVRLRQETVAPGEVFGGEFLGIHVLGEGLRGNLPREGCLVGDVYLPALRRGDHLDTFAHAEPFLDIGTVASYHAANMVWLDKHGVAGVHQGAQSLVEPQVTLVRSVLGKGAKARGAGLLDEVVVWPGAEVVAPLRRAVVMPQQVIVVP